MGLLHYTHISPPQLRMSTPRKTVKSSRRHRWDLKKPLAPFYHVTQGRRVDQVLHGGSFFSYTEGVSPYLQSGAGRRKCQTKPLWGLSLSESFGVVFVKKIFLRKWITPLDQKKESNDNMVRRKPLWSSSLSESFRDVLRRKIVLRKWTTTSLDEEKESNDNMVRRQSKVADDTSGTPKKPLAPFYHVTQGGRVDQVLQGGSFFSYAEGGSPYLQSEGGRRKCECCRCF
ncbi:hypothetical protein CEXT_405331 [Caerostris extrusa]|uniref:Uncharacterized protein n=1 Tax=Caerostris extrusa TaxID=172846 RepID=A0AAV4S6K3_CAEEX|nr:hypothetical protein CEXT_405331 [Caerostris extrusa]